MTIDSLTLALFSLVLLLPLGALAVAYRAFRRVDEVSRRLEEVERDLAFWRETGGHVLAGQARELESAAGRAQAPAGAEETPTRADDWPAGAEETPASADD